MDSVAITDHGGLYGAISFYKKAKEKNIKPIIGVELYFSPTSRLDKREKKIEKITIFYFLQKILKVTKIFQSWSQLPILKVFIINQELILRHYKNIVKV